MSYEITDYIICQNKDIYKVLDFMYDNGWIWASIPNRKLDKYDNHDTLKALQNSLSLYAYEFYAFYGCLNGLLLYDACSDGYRLAKNANLLVYEQPIVPDSKHASLRSIMDLM